MKMSLHDAGQMTKMAAMPIYGKTLQKSSSTEPAGRFSQTWFVASGTPAHHSLFK